MAINELIINSSAINEPGVIGANSEAINETLLFTGVAFKAFAQIESVLESFSLLSGSIPVRNGSLAIEEVINLLDTQLLALDGFIDDSFILSDGITGDINQLELIIEALTLIDAVVDTAERSAVLNESFLLLDSIAAGILKEVVESILLGVNSKDEVTALNKIVELVNIDDTLTVNKTLINSISDFFTIEDVTGTKAELTNLINDIILFFVGEAGNAQKEFITYILSPETNSVSTYSNYNFTGSCIFNGKQLLINDEGLHERGGVTDIGEEIIASIKTAAMDFGTPHLKRCLNLYLGLQNSNQAAYYEITRPTENLETQRITLGKGLVGRYWQFELITKDNTEFELESLDFLPLVLSRRI